jgi:toxin-antitoxin system PIN domain toxin
MLVDANILVFAVNRSSPFHRPAVAWLTDRLNGPSRVGLPWQSLVAFIRVVTHPRAFRQPISPEVAWARVADWLAAPSSWIPAPTDRHGEVLGALIRTHHLAGNLVPDAALAALAIEHGLEVCSADTDFARFHEIHWTNPIQPVG